jgi:hypothetical protein
VFLCVTGSETTQPLEDTIRSLAYPDATWYTERMTDPVVHITDNQGGTYVFHADGIPTRRKEEREENERDPSLVGRRIEGKEIHVFSFACILGISKNLTLTLKSEKTTQIPITSESVYHNKRLYESFYISRQDISQSMRIFREHEFYERKQQADQEEWESLTQAGKTEEAAKLLPEIQRAEQKSLLYSAKGHLATKDERFRQQAAQLKRAIEEVEEKLVLGVVISKDDLKKLSLWLKQN